MRMHRYLAAQHPLSKVYRVGAAVFGAGLIVFGVLGFTAALPFLAVATEPMMMGFGSDGLLSTISVIVGAILVGAAVRGGALASTTMATVGVLFLLSGLANLAVLDTMFNVLSFRFPNVVFSLLAGMALLFVGLYGRVSGGLGEDNPYVQARSGHTPADPAPARARLAELDEIAAAEYAVGNGHATPGQADLVHRDRLHRADEHHRRSNQHQQPTGPASPPR